MDSWKQGIIEVGNDVTIDVTIPAMHNLLTRVKLVIEENRANIERLYFLTKPQCYLHVLKALNCFVDETYCIAVV